MTKVWLNLGYYYWTQGAHSINEKLDRFNYVSGTKLLGAYLYEVAEAKA